MHQQTVKPAHSFTNRINKISSTLTMISPTIQTLQSSDQLLSTRHSHQKYKLSHSQIDKFDKLSTYGSMKYKPSKQLFKFAKESEEENHFTQHNYKKNNLDSNHNSTSRTEFNHSTNYHVTKDQFIRLQNNTSLHIEIIEFQIPSSDSQVKKISVICFEIHEQFSNAHFRSQFTLQTLQPQFHLMFDSVEEFFDFLTSQDGKQFLRFDLEKFQLELKVKFQKGSFKKQKTLKLHLLPFAVVQIVHSHHHEDQQKKQLQRKNLDLNKDIQSQQSLINALRQQNEKLKLNLSNHAKEIQTLKEQKQVLNLNYDKLSKAIESTKGYFFDFVPDCRAKNYSHFSVKSNSIRKQKNDLKWDQVSSQAPLPKSNRHYFTFLIKTFTPDYMFGIVTLKGKDTPNAFLGLETICLYLSKNNTFIYEQGKHYKISRTVIIGDTIIVIVDREKGVIEWMKKKEISSQKIPNQQLTTIQTSSKDHISDFSQQIQYIHSTKIPQQMLSHQLYAYLEVYNINEPLKMNEIK